MAKWLSGPSRHFDRVLRVLRVRLWSQLNELKLGLEHFGVIKKTFPADDLQALFECFDDTDDGVIQYDEFTDELGGDTAKKKKRKPVSFLPLAR